jgi:hypothetical protein
MTHCNVTWLTSRPVAFSGRESVYIDFFFLFNLVVGGGRDVLSKVSGNMKIKWRKKG